MHPKLRTTTIALLYFCLLGFQAAGVSAEPALSEKLVRNWIDSQKAFAEWGDAHAERLSAYQGNVVTEGNPLAISASEMVRPLKETGLQSSAEQLLRRYGFNSLEEWANLTLRITQSAAALQVDQQKESLDSSKLEALAASGQLSQEQQEMVSRAIQQNQQMLDYLDNNVSEEDKAAIRPYLGDLQGLLE
ncbi:MAG: hypothetical protein C9356_04395 [Oleiphilus sp.]|nr:MAG: hypothetical protein C9356_04395 [Oleiphilus sp.]